LQEIIILYNPYYNNKVIEEHVDVLRKSNYGKVGFGKIKSKIRDQEHANTADLLKIFESVKSENPLQLFLTDFSNAYVCYIEKIVESLDGIEYPSYYDNYEVEYWFVINDIREIARNNFTYIRDRFLANFTTPHYGNHTYALYGNRYVYPLIVEQKKRIDYFVEYSQGKRHYNTLFKSAQNITTASNLINYVFGEENFYLFHPDTIESLLQAEVEYENNKENLTYDFSSIVVNYGKVFELESHAFLSELFTLLIDKNNALKSITYQAQNKTLTLADYHRDFPSVGTNKFLLSQNQIFDAYTTYFNDRKKYALLLNFLKFEFKESISIIQTIRNSASHRGSTDKFECQKVRDVLLGIGQSSTLNTMLSCKKLLHTQKS